MREDQNFKKNERDVSLESKNRRNMLNFEKESQKEFFVHDVKVDERKHDK